MQSENQLKYDILMVKKIMAEGSIENIKIRILNRKFVLYSEKDQFLQVEFKFQSPSIITKIQLNLIRTFRFQLELMNSKKQTLEKFTRNLREKQDFVELISSTKQPISFAHLKIENNPIFPKRIGITYVIFKGFSDYFQEVNDYKNKNSANRKQKNDTIIEMQPEVIPSCIKKDPKAVNSKDLFKGRQKQKKSVRQNIQRLLSLTQYNQQNFVTKQQEKMKLQKVEQKIRKKVKHTQSKNNRQKQTTKKNRDRQTQQKQDTDLAIALSQSQQQMKFQNHYQKMEIENQQFHSMEQERLPAALENYIDEAILIPDRKYQTVEFTEQYISQFSNLSPKWLEAQRNAQQEAQVREHQKLSKYIRLKYLLGIQLFISGFPEWKQEELKHQAKQLGCKVIQEIKNHCLAIVSRDTCEKLRKKHRSWNQIKYLVPQYLQDCIKYQSKLSPKDYYIKI